MKVKVIPYRSDWPALYEAERSGIANALGNVLIRVHHIGSTAVEGLAAKPIIDLLLEVRSLEALDERTSALEVIGYEAMGEFGIPRRRYFRKGGEDRTHQMHAFLAGDPHVARHLAFRDYLRTHPEVLREYGALKERLAVECQGHLERYCDGKDTFVKYHEAQALRWSV